VILEDSGHCSQTTRPDSVAAHLIAFGDALVGVGSGQRAARATDDLVT
jgi:hypothetical protein